MANTAFSAFTIGKDMSLVIELNNVLGASAVAGKGTVLDVSDIGMLENFSCTPSHSTIEAKPISHGGVKKFRDKFEHWEGSFDIIRTGATTDLLLQVLQDALLTQGGSITVNIVQTVYDPMGAASGKTVFAWMDAVLSPSGGGSYNADNQVVNSFAFRAGRRDILSADGTTVSDAQTVLASLAAAIKP